MPACSFGVKINCLITLIYHYIFIHQEPRSTANSLKSPDLAGRETDLLSKISLNSASYRRCKRNTGAASEQLRPAARKSSATRRVRSRPACRESIHERSQQHLSRSARPRATSVSGSGAKDDSPQAGDGRPRRRLAVPDVGLAKPGRWRLAAPRRAPGRASSKVACERRSTRFERGRDGSSSAA